MRLQVINIFLFSVVTVLTVDARLAAQNARPTPTAAWAPKPLQTPAYPAGITPWVKLADIKARHKNEMNWREVTVDDGRLAGEYVSAAPGTKASRRFHPDTREWFAVIEGEEIGRAHV